MQPSGLVQGLDEQLPALLSFSQAGTVSTQPLLPHSSFAINSLVPEEG